MGKNIYEKEIVRVTLDNGMQIIVTPDHHMPTQHTFLNGVWDENIHNYKQAGELTKNDFVPVLLGGG